MPTSFDATITLNDHHLATVGLSSRKAEAVVAVRTAVECMDGAGWIDVEAQPFPPDLDCSEILYPSGRNDRLDTPAWRTLHQRVEETALSALRAAGTPLSRL